MKGVTKTDFMRGMQCERMLWLDKHRPEKKIIPPDVRRRLFMGNVFGDKAMGMLGPYEEMTVYRPGTSMPDKEQMVQNTRLHLRKGTPVICEAAFEWQGNYCACDLLRKTEQGYQMYEVKNAGAVKDVFIRDAAFQAYIVKRCGLALDKVFIVYHGYDEDDPFTAVEVTPEVMELLGWVEENLDRLNRARGSGQEIFCPMGPQCDTPYECWYKHYCMSEQDLKEKSK